MRACVLLLLLAACGATSHPKPEAPTAPWPVPSGWRTESFAFPIDFAPTLAHRGVEELRFAPGMFTPGDPGYWSYAFVWRLDDPADLAPDALAAELTTYYAGLAKALGVANAEDPHVMVSDAGAIVAHISVQDAPDQPSHAVDLTGVAVRRACGRGSLWVFAVAPATTGVRDELDALVASASCGQPMP